MFAPAGMQYFRCLLSRSVRRAGHNISIFIITLRFGIISYWFYRQTECMSVPVRVCVCVFLSLSFNDCLGFALSLPTRCRFHFQFSLSFLFSTQRESRISLPPFLSLFSLRSLELCFYGQHELCLLRGLCVYVFVCVSELKSAAYFCARWIFSFCLLI